MEFKRNDSIFISLLIFLLEFRFRILISIIIIFFGFLKIDAQPSGGPYGPVQQNYDLPKVSGKVFFVAPDGKAEQSGETLSQPTTIDAAMEHVKTGDAIVLRGGTYRTGNLIFNQAITIQPYKDEKVIVKGTYIAKNWKDLGNGLWSTSWTHLFPAKPADWWQRDKEGRITPLHRFNNDMVFVDGKFLQSAGWEGEVDANSYFIDYDSKKIYIGVNPSNKLIEITAFDVALLRTTRNVHGKSSDHRGPIIKGITFTQYSYRAIEIEGTEPEGVSPETDHGKDVIGTILENCTISFCSRVAGYFRGDSLVMKHCRISDTSTEGVYVIASNDILLEKNIFTRNNIENITGYYPAAVKIFNQCYRATVKDNLIIDLPNSNGVWYDVGEVDGRFINNWVEGVGNTTDQINNNQPWPSQNGFFFEISKGAICAGNLFINCDHGAWALNSSNVKFYNNTFVNSMAVIGRNARVPAGDRFGWHSSTGPDIDKREGHVFVNNLLYADKDFRRPLLYVWQPDSLCKKNINTPQVTQLDHNVYVRTSSISQDTLIFWSPAANQDCRIALKSPQELNKIHPEFSANSKYYSDYEGPLFKSPILNNYSLVPEFPGSQNRAELPAEIKVLIGQSKPYIGAYPFQ